MHRQSATTASVTVAGITRLLNPRLACPDLWQLLFLKPNMLELSAAEAGNATAGSLKVSGFSLETANQSRGTWMSGTNVGIGNKEHATFSY